MVFKGPSVQSHTWVLSHHPILNSAIDRAGLFNLAGSLLHSWKQASSVHAWSMLAFSSLLSKFSTVGTGIHKMPLTQADQTQVVSVSRWKLSTTPSALFEEFSIRAKRRGMGKGRKTDWDKRVKVEDTLADFFSLGKDVKKLTSTIRNQEKTVEIPGNDSTRNEEYQRWGVNNTVVKKELNGEAVSPLLQICTDNACSPEWRKEPTNMKRPTLSIAEFRIGRSIPMCGTAQRPQRSVATAWVHSPCFPQWKQE